MSEETAGKETILIVDDKVENLQVLIECLNKADFEILIAQDGEGAINQLSYVLPDIVLLDIMMPGMDGFETCRCLKENERTRDIPVIFMSALADTLDKVRGFRVGAADYVTKPFRHEEVIARINAHLTIRRQKKELAELNARLAETNRQLAESNSAKDKFFSIISHDMKNHFNTLIAGSELLIGFSDKMTEAEKKLILQGINKSSKDAFGLFDNLLEWSENQTGRIPWNPRDMNLLSITDTNLRLFRKAATDKHIEPKVEIDENLSVRADEYMLNTILRNLISNAIKFTDFGGNVRLRAKDSGNFVRVSVWDTGIGMSDEEIGKLFRMDANPAGIGTADEKGSGLGLILCKEFVEKNGGRIWAKSEKGKGSRFCFTLPKAGTPETDSA